MRYADFIVDGARAPIRYRPSRRRFPLRPPGRERTLPIRWQP